MQLKLKQLNYASFKKIILTHTEVPQIILNKSEHKQHTNSKVLSYI